MNEWVMLGMGLVGASSGWVFAGFLLRRFSTGKYMPVETHIAALAEVRDLATKVAAAKDQQLAEQRELTKMWQSTSSTLSDAVSQMAGLTPDLRTALQAGAAAYRNLPRIQPEGATDGH